jgi:hypothetical protein
VAITVLNDPMDGVTLDPLTGIVSVDPGTPAGTYNIEYQLCEVLNPTNCDDATVTVTVIAPEILANDDTYGPFNGYEGTPNAGNVLDNDLLNGDPVIPSEVTITVVNDPMDGVTLDPLTGIVSVDPGTPAGTYNIEYQLCENLNPTNCDDAVVTVTVIAPEILANDDTYGPFNGYEGTPNAGNVLDNDLLNGAPVIPSEVTITVVNDPMDGVTLDPLTGIVSVDPGTPAGTYNIEYQLCENLNPTNCDDATVTVTVIAPEILANDDTYGPFNGYEGTPNAGNVLDNDLLNGAPVIPSEVTITVVNDPMDGVTLDPLTGIVSVDPGTPAGTYNIEYQLCENLNPTNCDDATVTVTVIAPEILANDDTYGPFNGYEGTPNAGNVLDNDLLNGAPVIPSEVTITVVNDPMDGVTLDPLTGIVSVDPGTPAGTYNIEYQLCENLNPTNCDDATVTVTVIAPEILANDDTYGPFNGYEGTPNAGNVLDNDLLNGAPVIPSEVTITVVNDPMDGVTLDPLTGIVSVDPGTPAGTYNIEYQLCEVLNPTNCDDATVTVTVIAPEILANDDTYGPVNGNDGDPNAGNVLTNDLLNGAPVIPGEVAITVLNDPMDGVTLDPLTGIVSVDPGTPAGTYNIEYQLCEVLNPTNCDDATVTVTVIAPEILANDDTYGPFNGYEGTPNAGNVLDNDLLNGDPVIPGEVTITVVNDPMDGVTLDPLTGIVSVDPGTPAGTYNIEYQLCENLNPTNCDDATVTVTVIAPEILANDDTYGPFNGYEGTPNAGNVLDNDLLNGARSSRQK